MCVSVGYSADQHAYLCLDPTTNKIYTSRHVKFVESEFLFSSLATQTKALAPDSTLASPNQNKLTQIIQHPTTPISNVLAHITHPSAPSSPMPNDLAHTTQQQSPSSQISSELAEPTQISSPSSPKSNEVAQNIQISSPASPTSNELANITTSPTPPPPPPPTAPHTTTSLPTSVGSSPVLKTTLLNPSKSLTFMFAPYVPLNPAISLKPFVTLIGARLYKLNLMPYTTITHGILLAGHLLRIWLGVNGFFVSNEIRMAPLIVTRHD